MPPKDALTLKAPSRRIEWEIIVFMACVFSIPLIIINSGILGIKHSKADIARNKSHRKANVPLPTIPSSISEAFDGQRGYLWTELLSQCREISNMTSRNPSAACSLGNEDVFDKFLDVLRHLYGQTHESITKDSWRAHCQLQLSVRDTRSPILCEAAAFVALPFHLRPEGRRKVEEEVDKKPAKEVDAESARLVIVTVYSAYQQKQKLNKAISLTIKSACYRNISVNILGSGNKDIALEPGMKVSLLKNFVSSLKDPDNVVVLFVDGEDVMFQADSATILNKFLAQGKRVLFSADHSCSPMKKFPWNLNLEKWLGPCTGTCSNGRYVCDLLYPEPQRNLKDKTNRWLNSGGFIGFASDLQNILDSVSRIPADFLQTWPGTDQGIYTQLFLSGLWDIHIDYDSKIFLSFGLLDDPYEIYYRRPTTTTLLKEISQYDSFGNRTLTTWKSSIDGTVPSIVHFNADGKTILDSVSKNYMNVNYYKCKKTISTF